MLLGKLCERKDKTALVYMHSTLQSYFRNAKINLQNNTHNITSTTHPNLSFYLRETYRICNFLANCCDYTRKQYNAPISLSPKVYETSSKTGSRIRILCLLTGPIHWISSSMLDSNLLGCANSDRVACQFCQRRNCWILFNVVTLNLLMASSFSWSL